jgi:hypothetical protein
MRLELSPVTVADLEAAATVYGPETGDLVAPACQFGWPVEPSDTDGLSRRAAWSVQQQINQLAIDPTVRMVKVIDHDAPAGPQQIVSLGRWHEYPEGWKQAGDLEVSGKQARKDLGEWPQGMSREFFTALLDGLIGTRLDWQGTGPCWGKPETCTAHEYSL